MSKPNGYILHSDAIRVVIATGFRRKSNNAKTGDMIQIWIIRKDINPIAANKTNKDRSICGDCPLRGNRGKDRTCYVILKNAPLQVFYAYKRGSYPVLPSFELFRDRAVRFGAYGDPVHIPLGVIKAITQYASNWTGYTHQWRNPVFAGYSAYVMASIELKEDCQNAASAGWRSFRVAKDPSDRLDSEILCVNESRGVTCADCGLCSGSTVKAKSIVLADWLAKRLAKNLPMDYWQRESLIKLLAKLR